jgi:hypothetical protein
MSLKEYLTDHLKRGYIRPSKSPITSNFFFVGKKDGKLRPVQDYRDPNDITIKNATPLPLIPDLIDKLQGARYFTKFDVRWGYNNICIKHGDEWKAAFKCSFGLFEPLVMTFGVRNLLMVPSGTRRLKATTQEVSVNKDREEKSGVERSDEEEGCNVEDVEEVNDGQHEV